MSRKRFSVVLPARYGSTRFPGKPLAKIAGKPLIEWVYRRASEIRGVSEILVATDDERIAEAARAFGARAVMTSSRHETGTDRVAEVARGLESEYVVNLQGDEPVFDPTLVERMIGALDATPEADIATACHPIASAEEYGNPNVVKVVCDANGRALYFSRAPIPHGWSADTGGGQCPRRHVGIYAYRKDALLRFAALPRTPLERSERLEQLRALEHGMHIVVVETQRPTVGVDVPEDVKAVEKVILEFYTGVIRPGSESRRP